MRHRSRWSHGPLLGTTIRVLYSSLWLGLVGLMVVDLLNNLGRTALSWSDLGQGLGWLARQHWRIWLALLVGLELGALSHVITDWLSTRAKRRRTARKKRRPASPRPRN
jgi:uncharacterized metal-binding protein